jgi:hypothetical protein
VVGVQLEQQIKAKEMPTSGNSASTAAMIPALNARTLCLASPGNHGGTTEDAFRIIPVPDDEVQHCHTI